MFRAKVNGQEIMVSVHSDGSVWTHRLGRGFVMLAEKHDSYLWLLGHVLPEELPRVRELKGQWADEFIQSHLAG